MSKVFSTQLCPFLCVFCLIVAIANKAVANSSLPSLVPKKSSQTSFASAKSKKLGIVKDIIHFDNIFQNCQDYMEAYSASYLVSKEHLLNQFTSLDLRNVKCEHASFMMMNNLTRKHESNGSMFQSIDLLDFSVIHLSTYERSLRRYPRFKGNLLSSSETVPLVSVMKNASTLLKYYDHFIRNVSSIDSSTQLVINRTVVIMPYLGSEIGQGNSVLAYRIMYLEACFWSFYAVYSHIVVAVANTIDFNYIREQSNLPFYDVILLSTLPRSRSLPVATVQMAKSRMLDGGTWSRHFDYLFFTESDQMLISRVPKIMYEYLHQNPRHVLVPHRLMAYPNSVLTAQHNKTISTHGPVEWMRMSCCMPRQQCTTRIRWVDIGNSKVSVLSMYGIQIPLGNSDFLSEKYRFCTLHEGKQDFC